MLYIRGHKIIKGYIGDTPISHVGFGKSGLIKIKSENGGSDYPNNLIAKYTTNTSGVLPTFNSGYQYTINETESNGIYTVELFSDDDFTSCRFNGKSELLTVEYLKVTSNVKDMSSMFNTCTQLTHLDVSNWDTSKVANMYNMFYSCSKLTQLDVSNFNTSKVQYMHYMFTSCSSLTQLDVSNWDTSNVTNMGNMFNSCKSLTLLDVSNFDTSKVTNMSNFIANTSVLQNFISCAIPVSFGASGTVLTHDSLMSIINNLTTVATTQTLTLGSTNLAKLSSEEKAIATNKGWTLA